MLIFYNIYKYKRINLIFLLNKSTLIQFFFVESKLLHTCNDLNVEITRACWINRVQVKSKRAKNCKLKLYIKEQTKGRSKNDYVNGGARVFVILRQLR